MSVYLSNGRGSYVIERDLRRLGTIRLATGCPPTPEGRATAAAMEQMILVLARPTGRPDIVRAIIKRQLPIDEVWTHYQRGEWQSLPRPAHLVRAFPVTLTDTQLRRKVKPGAIGRWLPGYVTSKGTCSPGHRDRMRGAFRVLERTRPKALVIDLPEVLAAFRAECATSGHHVQFNRARAALMTFCRSELGRRSDPIWGLVADIPVLKPGEGQSTKREGQRMNPAEARAVRDALPPHHAAHWWAMCTTGMMPDEYFAGKFTELASEDAVRIDGTKRTREGADGRRRRTVPRLAPIGRPTTARRQFRDVLALVTEGRVQPYDARRTYSYWLERAGVDPVVRDILMGHAEQSMGALYRGKRADELLAEVRRDLLEYLGPEPATAVRLVVAS